MARRRYRGDHRSGLEDRTAAYLTSRGINFEYETESLQYYKKVPKSQCEDCGGTQVLKEHWYTPDFILDIDAKKIYIEMKGKFSGTDRVKMVLVKEAHPELDIRMVFMRDNWITKEHKNRYSDWAIQKGFPWAVGSIPDGWIEEK